MKLRLWKAAVLLVTLAVISGVSFAETRVGIGASMQQSFESLSTIYVPIKTDNYLFEPTLSYYNSNDDIIDFNQTRFILGIYRYMKRSAETSFYYGAKIGYTTNEDDFDGDIDKSEGIFFAPSLGGEYAFNNNFSIGVDVSLAFLNVKNESEGSFPDEYDTKETGTVADVVLRYMF